jgi:hypothetical protein
VIPLGKLLLEPKERRESGKGKRESLNIQTGFSGLRQSDFIRRIMIRFPSEPN